jgi:hypothetical protein
LSGRRPISVVFERSWRLCVRCWLGDTVNSSDHSGAFSRNDSPAADSLKWNFRLQNHESQSFISLFFLVRIFLENII